MGMGILSLVVLGLIVGLLAKFIMPGKDPGGILVTIIIGIVGAFLGGYIGKYFGLGEVAGFDLTSILLGTGGSVILLLIFRLLKKK